MPSACSRATAGATMAASSSPSAPSSPACGLSPATARRGRAMPKRAVRSRATMRPVSTIEVGGQVRHHLAQRQMDGHRHHRKLRRPQHHHRPHRLAGRFRGEPGQEFGVARLGKARAVEHVLGDRIGDQRGGVAGQHVGDRAADRGDRRRRAASVGLAGRGGDRQVERRRPARRARRRRRPAPAHGGERHVEAEDARARRAGNPASPMR